MSEAALKYLESQWKIALEEKNYLLAGKILRSEINILKGSDGLLTAHRDALTKKVERLEDALAFMDVEGALPVIGHIRHARKAIQLTSGNFGAAFKRKLSPKERAKIRKRNKSPALSLQNRAQLGLKYASGPPSDVLQPNVLGNGDSRLA